MHWSPTHGDLCSKNHGLEMEASTPAVTRPPRSPLTASDIPAPPPPPPAAVISGARHRPAERARPRAREGERDLPPRTPRTGAGSLATAAPALLLRALPPRWKQESLEIPPPKPHPEWLFRPASELTFATRTNESRKQHLDRAAAATCRRPKRTRHFIGEITCSLAAGISNACYRIRTSNPYRIRTSDPYRDIESVRVYRAASPCACQPEPGANGNRGRSPSGAPTAVTPFPRRPPAVVSPPGQSTRRGPGRARPLPLRGGVAFGGGGGGGPRLAPRPAARGGGGGARNGLWKGAWECGFPKSALAAGRGGRRARGCNSQSTAALPVQMDSAREKHAEVLGNRSESRLIRCAVLENLLSRS